MINVSDKIFLCYAWDDMAEVRRVVTELESELDIKISTTEDFAVNAFEASDETYRSIENASIVILFITGASKKTAYVKECILRAQNTNKNILPIEIEKSKFTSMPSEFKFRTKPYNYNDKDGKAKLLAQLKASLGINIENGDEVGAVVRVVTDLNAYVSRNGERLDTVFVGKDNRIRLRQGTHLLEFVAVDDYEIRCSMSYEVYSNAGEQYLSVSLADLFNKKQEEKEFAAQQAAIRKEIRERELEHLRRAEEEAARIRQQQREEALRKEQELELQKQQGHQTVDVGGGDISPDKLDPLFADAARVVVFAQHGSVSLIQRKLEIGYNRAGHIMDQLCRMGIVGEQEGSNPRQVLCANENDLEEILRRGHLQSSQPQLPIGYDLLNAEQCYEKAVQADAEKDYATAFKWYLAGAEKGNDMSQYKVAVRYDFGLGVATSKSEARKWYRLAASNGNREAADKLRELGESVRKQHIPVEGKLLKSLKLQLQMQKSTDDYVVTDVCGKNFQCSVLQSGRACFQDGVEIPSNSSYGLCLVFFFDEDNKYHRAFKSLDCFSRFTERTIWDGRNLHEYYVDFGEDAKTAARILSVILDKVYGITDGEQFDCYVNSGANRDNANIQYEGNQNSWSRWFGEESWQNPWAWVLGIIIFILLKFIF